MTSVGPLIRKKVAAEDETRELVVDHERPEIAERIRGRFATGRKSRSRPEMFYSIFAEIRSYRKIRGVHCAANV